MEKMKSFFSAIIFSILGLICYYILGMLATLLGVLIKVILSYIPFLKSLVQFDIEYIAAVFAIFIVDIICDKVIKNDTTKKYSIIFFSVLLIVLNLAFLILNAFGIGEGSVLANIIQLIVGAIALNKGIKHTTDDE